MKSPASDLSLQEDPTRNVHEAFAPDGPPTIALTLPGLILDRRLFPNAGAPTRTVGRLRRQLRLDVGMALQSALHDLPLNLLPDARSRPGVVWCRWTIGWERNPVSGRHRSLLDPDNAAAGLKGATDSLADVGLIADDKHLRHLPVGQVKDPEGIGFLTVELWTETEEPR